MSSNKCPKCGGYALIGSSETRQCLLCGYRDGDEDLAEATFKNIIPKEPVKIKRGRKEYE